MAAGAQSRAAHVIALKNFLLIWIYAWIVEAIECSRTHMIAHRHSSDGWSVLSPLQLLKCRCSHVSAREASAHGQLLTFFGNIVLQAGNIDCTMCPNAKFEWLPAALTQCTTADPAGLGICESPDRTGPASQFIGHIQGRRLVGMSVLVRNGSRHRVGSLDMPGPVVDRGSPRSEQHWGNAWLAYNVQPGKLIPSACRLAYDWTVLGNSGWGMVPNCSALRLHIARLSKSSAQKAHEVKT
jgi:hypothetical protein